MTAVLSMPALAAADTTAPVLAAVWKIKAFTNDTTPRYYFSTTEGGTLLFGGDCTSTTTTVPSPVPPAVSFTKIITYDTLSEGTHSNCTIQVRDNAGNISAKLLVRTFTIDTVSPVLDQVKPVAAAAIDNKPVYVFSSTESGAITYGGDCSSLTLRARAGSNQITFDTLSLGMHSNCTIRVSDAAGNQSNLLGVPPFTINDITAMPLNDTGATTCGDYAKAADGYSGEWHYPLDCAATGSDISVEGVDNQGDPVPAGQDAMYGRDAISTTNSDTDGLAGFSFTKLDASGTELAIQSSTWSDSGSESAGSQWSCVKDNITGLVWEVKTSDYGLRDKDWTYNWYNPDLTNNGGYAGEPDTEIGSGSDNCADNARCDTDKYVIDVNALDLCGETANDWRLPSIDELYSLVAKSHYAPAIDSRYFPDTGTGNWFWSSSPTAGNHTSAWYMKYLNGSDGSTLKTNANYVRLVRTSK